MEEKKEPAGGGEESLPTQDLEKASVPSTVRPLRTYRADVENVIGEKRLSLVGIAAREMDRGGGETPREPRARMFLKFLPLITGVILAAGGIGIVSYAYLAAKKNVVEPVPGVRSIVP